MPGAETVANRILLLGLGLALAGCAAPTEATRVDLQGAWSGSVDQPEVHLTVTLSRTSGGPSGQFDGSGQLWGAGPRVDLSVTATVVGDSVTLMLAPPGYVPIRFDASPSPDALQLVGTLDGSGINALPFVLARTQ
jgi:hypothetical protein